MIIDFRVEVDKCKDVLMDDLINFFCINLECDDL